MRVVPKDAARVGLMEVVPDNRVWRRVLISPRILVVERWLRVRSRARDKTNRTMLLGKAMRAVQ